MNFFEQELRKITVLQPTLTDAKILGKVCYIPLTDNTRMCLEFITARSSENYEAIRATVFDKENGKIDILTLSFLDVWGKKKVDHKNFEDGVNPHLWTSYGKTDWYVYKPTFADYEELSQQLESYAELFMEQEQIQGLSMNQQM